MLTLSPALSSWPRELGVLGDVAAEVHDRRRPAHDLLGRRAARATGPSTSSWYCSGLSQNAWMPCEIELRVVSLPATAISRKKRLKSISDERVAVDLGVEQRGDDVVARHLAALGRERVRRT